MKLDPVFGSSNIAATGHDPATNTLHVRFTSGHTYSYDGVSAAEHSALRAAPSVGSHFHKFIRSKYEGVRV